MRTKISTRDINKINRNDQTLVIHKNQIYDVTKFSSVHPGGQKLITSRHGKDVTSLMKNGPHAHSENAYQWLEQYYVADLASDSESSTFENTVVNGRLNPEITNKNTESRDIVDWTKPMLWQVGNLGEKYHEWVDKPVDRKLRLFYSDFCEYFSNTKWFVIPIVWIPFCVAILTHVAFNHSENIFFQSIPMLRISFPFYYLPLVFVVGALSWSLLEYVLHRWLFHADPPVESYSLITLHFLLHGQHHKVPFDKGRLVFPPVASSVFLVILYVILKAIFPTGFGLTYMTGVVFGYVCYDLTHYYLHYGSPAKGGYFARLRSYHVRHHFESPTLGFGISSKLWDYPFNTLIKPSKKSQ